MRFGIVSIALAMAAPANAVTVGYSYDGGCYPFGCFTESEGIEYQQVYDASAFSGPISISGISFNDYASEGMDMGDANYRIDFFLTSKGVNGLSTDLASNRSSLLGNFGTFNIAGPNPQILTIDGAAFNYDPSWGNLLMSVVPISFIRTGTLAYWETDVPPDYQPDPWTPTIPDQTSAVWSTGKFGTQIVYGGLVTTFSTRAISAVPEPQNWALMIGGFGMIGAAMRRRPAALRVAPADYS